ncbi:DedA family protein [Fulvimarina endophytica]|uniref:DedA family protein n=1 Tax=Fulvimarina endophytica TaxID=2293836 RepID=A0A371X0F2_9HYPH|nr:YqaA family protein [Fulvimarina endophytica]RFC62692.1 DedA family protein [Fulvimarina endophytica]
MTLLSLLAGLFWSAFLAATILPGASELLLIAVIAEAGVDPVVAVLVAGTGNTLGSLVNWVMGCYAATYRDRRWFPVSKAGLDRAENLFRRYGIWTLFFAWWPIGGDALTLAAGVLKVPMPIFLFVVGIGKFARYAVVAYGTLQFQ